MFNTKEKGYGFGAMPGFNKRKLGGISNGDYDRDGVKNKKDCEPFNFRKQDGGSNGLSQSKIKEILLKEPGHNPKDYVCVKCKRLALSLNHYGECGECS